MTPQNNNSKKPAAPHTLPTFDDANIEMHTMQQDIQKMSPKSEQLEPAQQKPELPKIEIPEPPKAPNQELSEVEKPRLMETPEKKPSPFDRFRKPREDKESSSNISKFKEMLPKTTMDQAKTTEPKINQDIPTEPKMPSPEIPSREIPPQVPQNDLEIKIPSEGNKLPLLIALSATLIVLVGGAGLWYYWFFVKDSTPIAHEETTEQPTIIEIPDKEPAEMTTPKPTPIIPELVEIAEPQSPTSFIYFDQTAITTVSQENQNELIQNLKIDVSYLAGGGSITRHLFKVSNSQEKRFISSSELLKDLGIFIPSNILSELNDIEFISYKIDSKVNYGLIAKILNKESVLTKMEVWEAQSIQDIKQLYMGEPIIVPESPEFAENTYLDFTKRYINLTNTDLSLDYAVSDNYLIITTSKDMMFASILQTQK